MTDCKTNYVKLEDGKTLEKTLEETPEESSEVKCTPALMVLELIWLMLLIFTIYTAYAHCEALDRLSRALEVYNNNWQDFAQIIEREQLQQIFQLQE